MSYEKKKIDSRIKSLIENCVKQNHRSFFVIVGGDDAKYQVANLHYILSKATLTGRPNILWCYKNNLVFSEKAQKKIKKSKHLKNHGIDTTDPNDPFDLFIGSSEIRYCYYAESEKILGCTFGMCVLQDFEAITPNLLAKAIETVKGGGIVVLLLGSMKSLADFCAMTMDVHTKYRTERHSKVVGRFNERFIFSLADCSNCLVVDDRLNILPLSGSLAKDIVPIEGDIEMSVKKPEPGLSFASNPTSEQMQQALLKLAHGSDQLNVITEFIQLISTDSSFSTTVSLTAARGRGKSAALGLSVAAALLLGKYSNVFVTSPAPENLQTFFSFVIAGLKAVGLREHQDFSVSSSVQGENNRNSSPITVKIVLTKWHRQTVRYIQPTESTLVGQAELVVIDEAAAIPLPLVRSFLSPNHLLFLASTINGYEGTGRSLSLKLIQELRESKSNASLSLERRKLIELRLETPIRYASGDPVENWLNHLLCLSEDVTSSSITNRPSSAGCPHPETCDLYYVNRDTLFSYHKASEAFLSRIISLFTASHYKNSPNDLQLLSDAPGHHLFVLLAPVDEESTHLPEILCAIHVCLEGEISRDSILDSLSRGARSGGDLIPWTISQQFQDDNFASLSGARVVRISTNPDYQRMGYGSRAIELLQMFFQGKFSTSQFATCESSEEAMPSQPFDAQPVRKTTNRPLLSKLDEIGSLGTLHWIGVAFGLTASLLKFWKRSGFLPLYIRQTTNELTGEHSAIMLKTFDAVPAEWLLKFNADFCARFMNLLSYPKAFASFSSLISLSVLENSYSSSLKLDATSVNEQSSSDSKNTIPFSSYSIFDLKRLEAYSNNMVDYHLILDLVPHLALTYFLFTPTEISFSPVQSTILLGIGLQRKHLEAIETELNLPASQLLAMFTKIIKKFCTYIRTKHFSYTAADTSETLMKGNCGIVSLPSSNSTPKAVPAVTFASLVEKYQDNGNSKSKKMKNKK